MCFSDLKIETSYDYKCRNPGSPSCAPHFMRNDISRHWDLFVLLVLSCSGCSPGIDGPWKLLLPGMGEICKYNNLLNHLVEGIAVVCGRVLNLQNMQITFV